MNQCVSGPSTGLAPSHRSPRRIPGGGGECVFGLGPGSGLCMRECMCVRARARACVSILARAPHHLPGRGRPSACGRPLPSSEPRPSPRPPWVPRSPGRSPRPPRSEGTGRGRGERAGRCACGAGLGPRPSPDGARPRRVAPGWRRDRCGRQGAPAPRGSCRDGPGAASWARGPLPPRPHPAPGGNPAAGLRDGDRPVRESEPPEAPDSWA